MHLTINNTHAAHASTKRGECIGWQHPQSIACTTLCGCHLKINV